MCGSMVRVDIPCETAKIRPGKEKKKKKKKERRRKKDKTTGGKYKEKKKEEKRRNHRTKIQWPALLRMVAIKTEKIIKRTETKNK